VSTNKFPSDASTATVAASVSATGELTVLAKVAVPVNVGDDTEALAANVAAETTTVGSDAVPPMVMVESPAVTEETDPEAAAAHFKPVVVDESAVSTWLFDPTPRRAGVEAAVAA
jgi:hypothetical protein